MKKRIWDLYAPIYKRAMKADQKIYDYMYTRIPEVIRDKEVLELATGPGLLAKRVAPAAKRMIATDYSDGTDPTSLKFEKIIDGMKNYTSEEIEAALRAAGFSEVTSDHHPSKPWITVLARK